MIIVSPLKGSSHESKAVEHVSTSPRRHYPKGRRAGLKPAPTIISWSPARAISPARAGMIGQYATALRKNRLICPVTQLPRDLNRESRIGHVLERYFPFCKAALRLNSFDDIFHSGARRNSGADPCDGHEIASFHGDLPVHIHHFHREVDRPFFGIEQRFFRLLQSFDNSLYL